MATPVFNAKFLPTSVTGNPSAGVYNVAGTLASSGGFGVADITINDVVFLDMTSHVDYPDLVAPVARYVVSAINTTSPLNLQLTYDDTGTAINPSAVLPTTAAIGRPSATGGVMYVPDFAQEGFSHHIETHAQSTELFATVTEAIAGGGGAVASDAIFDAKGDLPVGTAANTAARLAVGVNGRVLSANSATATGLEWIVATSGLTPAFSEIHVAPAANGGNDANAGTAQAPFLTWAAANTAAEALTPTASNPVTIRLSPGVFASAAMVLDTSYIHTVGSGTDSTIVTLNTGVAITMTAANTSISNLSIIASGANVGPLLTTPATTNHATFKNALVARDIRVVNSVANGVAIGQWSGDIFSSHIEGDTAVDLCYGGRFTGCVIEATTYGVKRSASIGVGEDDPNVHLAEFTGCSIKATAGNAKVFTGLRENTTAIPSYPLQVPVTWLTRLNGCNILGPAGGDGVVTSDCFTMRGAFLALGCSIFGANTFRHCHDLYMSGCYLVNVSHSTIATFMNGCRGVHIDSSTLIPAFTINPIQFVDTFDCTIIGGTVENPEALDGMAQYQNYTQNLAHLGAGGVCQVIDYHTRNVAARFTSQRFTDFRIPSTAAFALTTMTVEFWFRSNTIGGCAIGGIMSAGAGWLVGLVPGALPLGKVNYAHGAQSNESELNIPIFDGLPHHVALVVTGGATVVYVDGVASGTPGTAGTPSGASVIRIGSLAISPTTASSHFHGDLWEIRISNNARYTSSFTPKKRHVVDTNTLALWPAYTEEPMTWNEATGMYDARMPAYPYVANLAQLDYCPYWAPMDRALPPVPEAEEEEPTPPTNTVAPVISGDPEWGSVLSCSPGTWDPVADEYEYQWFVADNSIDGETTNAFTTREEDLTFDITCKVRARETGGAFWSLWAVSNAITVTAP